jgi:hypothetical protein
MDINTNTVLYFTNMFVFNNSQKILPFMYNNHMVPRTYTDNQCNIIKIDNYYN